MSLVDSYNSTHACRFLTCFENRQTAHRVLHRLNDFKADDASTGDYSQQEEESEAEATHRRAIDQEKTVYKTSFDRLRVLKPEIEHISKVSFEYC